MAKKYLKTEFGQKFEIVDEPDPEIDKLLGEFNVKRR